MGQLIGYREVLEQNKNLKNYKGLALFETFQ